MRKARQDIVTGAFRSRSLHALPKRVDYDAYYDHPTGMLPDGTINLVKADDPPFKPKVYDNHGRLLSDEELEELEGSRL
jgi:hypothetical protein